MRYWFLLLTLSPLFLAGSSLFASPILNLPPGVNSSSLSVTTFASGLPYPYSMQVLPDGSLLSGISSGSDYLFANGGLMRFAHAGDPGTVVYSGLPYPVQTVRSLGNGLVAVAEAGVGASEIAFLQQGANPTDPYTKVGAIQFSPSDPAQIYNITMATRPTQGQAGSYDLIFSMGGDTDHTNSTGFTTLSGLTTGTLAYNSLGMVTITPGGGAPAVSGLKQIASGLRNTAGLVFDPSGNLYLNDNGWDVPGTGTPQAADELDFISASDVGSIVPNFGFADNYIEYGTGTFVGGQGVPPIAAFQPLNGVESLGIAEMALAPSNFPTGLNNGLFITFYGEWEQGGVNDTTDALLYYDFGTGKYEDFILPGQAGIGHLTSIVSTNNALYIGDINANGTIRSGPIDGVIYEIQALSNTPEPGTLPCAALGATAMLLLKRRRVASGNNW